MKYSTTGIAMYQSACYSCTTSTLTSSVSVTLSVHLLLASLAPYGDQPASLMFVLGQSSSCLVLSMII